jgi:hypothetical protein
MEQDMQEKHSYKGWCELLALNEKIKILDNDGFRDIENFSEDMEFTREEFNKRLMICTIISI